jgi:hypothetical protein
MADLLRSDGAENSLRSPGRGKGAEIGSFSLVLRHPGQVGLGIDEDAALLVTDDRSAEVAGRTPVMVVDGRKERGALVVQLLSAGDHFDLEKRKRSKPTTDQCRDGSTEGRAGGPDRPSEGRFESLDEG